MLKYQFSRPFAFRKIRHPDLRLVNVWLPLVLTLVLLIAYVLLPVKPGVFGERSITDHALSFLALLPGFFIAALAAVSTFQRPELDEVMPEPSPELEMRTGGSVEPVPLTHRLFLCHLFSYLTVLSFGAIATAVVGDLLAPSVAFYVGIIANSTVRCILDFGLNFFFLGVFFWLLSNLIVTTMYGLYFLVERIHRPHS